MAPNESQLKVTDAISISEAQDGTAVKGLHVVTPCLRLPFAKQYLPAAPNVTVFGKLECVQPSGSFKVRGISWMAAKAVASGCQGLITSSGGNAAYAAAYSAQRLGVPYVVCVPTVTPDFIIEALRNGEKGEVVVHGKNWDEAHARALEIQAESQGKLFMVHPFDHPDIWEGHSTIVDEIEDQLVNDGPPSCIVVAVGGGGLLLGVLKGVEKKGWTKTKVLVMETIGADCYNQSVKAGKLVSLPDITSVARCLGALKPADELEKYLKSDQIISEVVEDDEALRALITFTDDQRCMTEPACGAALAALYSGVLNKLIEEGSINVDGPIVVVVCGGNIITTELLDVYKKRVSDADQK